MNQFFAGLMIGLALAGAGLYGYAQKVNGCLSLCGSGTRCDAHRCVVAVVDAGPAVAVATKDARKKRRGAGSGTGAGGGELKPAAPEAQLKPGDDKPLAQGDALGRPEHIDLTQPGDEGRALSQDDLDRVFHPSEPAITKCITTALGDAPLESGKVEVSMRVERGGEVSKVRVEAPTLLQRNGLHACVRRTVTALHFPPSGGANIVTYPFELK